ncbi:MAG: diacylglycerol kinase family protein [Candidatus Omnitrophica bacterium]|nr:diacylglycerol kinase family protein [Candidatus Omnitrophota bacterium]
MLSSSRFAQSVGFAWEGLTEAWNTQRNFRIQVFIAAMVSAGGVMLGFTTGEWMVVLIVMGMVLSAELLNTAIETAVDWLGKGRTHPQAKKIKDLSAASVLVLSVTAGSIGLFLMARHIGELPKWDQRFWILSAISVTMIALKLLWKQPLDIEKEKE